MNGKLLRSGLALLLLLSLGLVPKGVSSVQAADTWVAQNSGTQQVLFGVDAADASVAWAVGASGTILNTTNGGTTWASQTNPVYTSTNPVSLLSVAAVSTTTAWAAGAPSTAWDGGASGTSRGTILYTNNGGATWTAQNSGVGADIRGVAAVDANSAWVVGTSAIVRKTVNGGVNWDAPVTNPLPTGSTVTFRGVAAAGTSVWVVGIGGTIVRTTNGGLTWDNFSIASGPQLNGVAALDANTAWVLGDGGFIRKVTIGIDGLATYTTPTSVGTTGTLNAVAAVNATTGWAVGGSGTATILKTTDGGATWPAQTNPASTIQEVTSIAGVDSSTAWAVGAGGTILKSSAPPPPSNTATVSQSMAVQAIQVSVTVSPTAVDYGPIALGGTSAPSPTITATNTGAGPETFLVQGSDATATVAGDSNWTLGPSPGTNVYSNDFSGDSGASFTALTTAGQTLATSVAAAGTKTFVLRVRAPTATTGNGIRNATVTVIATTAQ